MKNRTVSEVKIHLGKIIKEEIKNEPQIITYRKKAAAVLISYEDYQTLLAAKRQG